MALFELDNGHLVQAQFGREVPEGLTPEVLGAVRSQVLEIIARPLFPITWQGFSRVAANSVEPRLTALDASGQVVAVEVVSTLDAEILIDSLSRLADTAAMSLGDLAAKYPGKVEGFRADWTQFRASMPPSPSGGPRLILVAGSIHPDVRPALDVLSASGIEVHEMSLRQMSNGRAFLEVTTVGPRMYGHRANLLATETGSVAAVEQSEVRRIASAVGVEPKAHNARVREHPIPEPDHPEQAHSEHLPPEYLPPEQIHPERPVPERPMPERSRPKYSTPEHVRPGQVPSQRSAPARQRPVPFPSRAAQRVQAEPTVSPYPSRLDNQTPQETEVLLTPGSTLNHNTQGLSALAAILGRTTPLALSLELGISRAAQLTISGRILVSAGEFVDPTAALEALGVPGVDGWKAWHLGDGYGPSLAESIDEINRDGNR